MHNKKNEAKAERLQQALDSGVVSKHYPDVESIVISALYTQKGMKSSLRTLYFYPESYAMFKVACMSRECVDGGLDMTNIITKMVGTRKAAQKGELSCEGNGRSSDHSAISYEVAIQYA